MARPALVLWYWQLLFHFADQGVEGLARDGDKLPFLGNRDRGRHRLHVEASAFELIAEGALVLLEDLDFVLDREIPFQKLADHLEIYRNLRPFRGLGHRPAPFSKVGDLSPHGLGNVLNGTLHLAFTHCPPRAMEGNRLRPLPERKTQTPARLNASVAASRAHSVKAKP